MPRLQQVGRAFAILAAVAAVALLTWWIAAMLHGVTDLNDKCNVPKHPETRCDD